MGVHVLRATLAGVWIGLLGGLSFIETPLKFLAPDVTLPIALGIGRLVLTGANIAGAVLLVALTIVSSLQPRVPRRAWYAIGALWLVLLVEVAVIRPPLNARTDAILAGQDPGDSPLHVIYIAADLMLLVLLVLYVVLSRPRAVPLTRPDR
jgi:hypothetical protein